MHGARGCAAPPLRTAHARAALSCSARPARPLRELCGRAGSAAEVLAASIGTRCAVVVASGFAMRRRRTRVSAASASGLGLDADALWLWCHTAPAHSASRGKIDDNRPTSSVRTLVITDISSSFRQFLTRPGKARPTAYYFDGLQVHVYTYMAVQPESVGSGRPAGATCDMAHLNSASITE